MSSIVEHLDTASEDSADERRPQESASTAGAGLGGGKKRKVPLESGQERKRGRKSSSRGTTSSQGRTEHVKEEQGASNDIVMDHDQKRIDDGYNLDTIDDDVEMTTSAAAAPSTSSSSSQHRVDGRGRRRKHDDGCMYVQANVLSRVYTKQKLQVWYKNERFPATAITDSGDYTQKLLQVMLDLQKLGPEQIKKLSPEAEAVVIDILEKMRAKIHYTGWNKRHDEHVTFDRLMVTVDDEAAALKRFEKLPRGNEISDDTLALFEEYRLPSVTDKQQDLGKRARREEQSEGDVDEPELDVRKISVDSEGYVGSDSDGKLVKEAEEEEELEDGTLEKPETVSKEANGRKSDTEGDDNDEQNIDEQERPRSQTPEIPERQERNDEQERPPPPEFPEMVENAQEQNEARSPSPDVPPEEEPDVILDDFAENVDIAAIVDVAENEVAEIVDVADEEAFAFPIPPPDTYHPFVEQHGDAPPISPLRHDHRPPEDREPENDE